MGTVITGKSLRVVRNSGKAATDHPDTRRPGRTIVGKPVNIVGAAGTLVKYTGVPDDLYAAIVAEPDPAKRNALLTNVGGLVLAGTRSAISRTVFAAFVAEHLAAVAADPEDPTDDERAEARARVQSFLTGGLVCLPGGDADEEDALSWAFGIADDDDEEDEEATA